MSNRGTETTFELTTIERLEREGYVWQSGPDIQRLHNEVVLKDVLRENTEIKHPRIVNELLPLKGQRGSPCRVDL